MLKKLITTLAALTFVVLLAGKVNAANGFGKKLTYKAGEVYYQAPVTEKQADALGTFLLEMEYFDERPKTVQLLKGERYQVRFVVNPTAAKNIETQEVFRNFGTFISVLVFANQPIDVHLTDTTLSTFCILPVKPTE